MYTAFVASNVHNSRSNNMKAAELAKQAVQAAKPFDGILAEDVCHKISLSHVAQWLFNQDESVRESAVRTACAAMDLLVKPDSKG